MIIGDVELRKEPRRRPMTVAELNGDRVGVLMIVGLHLDQRSSSFCREHHNSVMNHHIDHQLRIAFRDFSVIQEPVRVETDSEIWAFRIQVDHDLVRSLLHVQFDKLAPVTGGVTNLVLGSILRVHWLDATVLHTLQMIHFLKSSRRFFGF